MEGRISQMVEALERAADAGQPLLPPTRLGSLKSQVDSMTKQYEVEASANKALEEERQGCAISLIDGGLLDARDNRLTELEEQLERSCKVLGPSLLNMTI